MRVFGRSYLLRVYSVFILSISLFYFSGSILRADRDGVGTSGAQFLKIPVDARAIAMGEAYSSVSDGSESIYWNPAGLSRVEGKSLSVMHALYFQETYTDFLSYAQKVGALGTFGGGFQFLSGSSIDKIDEFGTNVGTFRPYDLALSVGWSRKFPKFGFGEGFAVGLAGKFIQSRILRTAHTEAIDFGLNWALLKEKCRVSFVVQNMGSVIKFRDTGDDLPLIIKFGSSYRLFDPLLLAFDLNFPRDNHPNFALGSEYKKHIARDIWVAGRGGFNSRTVSDIYQLSSISLGTGFGWRGYWINFAWVPFGRLGNTYRFSFSAKF